MKATVFAFLLCAFAIVDLSVSPPVYAQTSQATLLTCTGTGEVTYSPGLTFTPTFNTYKVNATLAPCLGTVANVATARFSTSGAATLSCEVLTDTVTKPSYAFIWGDRTQSQTQTDTVVVQRPLGEIVRVETGHVVSGRFAGDTVVSTYTFLDSNLTACLAGGVTSTGGPVVVAVLGSSP